MKKILLVMVLMLLLFILSACVTKHGKKDIEDYVRNRLRLTNFDVSNGYKEFSDEKGYTDKIWTVENLENDVIFHVLDDYHYSEELTRNDREAICTGEGNYSIINIDTGLGYPGLFSTIMSKVSISTFYDILKAEGFNPSGTPEEYSFVNKNGEGEKYTFSYDFYNDIGNGNYIFYYLKDDERVELESGLLSYHDIE